MEDIHYNGHWWLPNEPNNKIHGSFSFTRSEGGELKLDKSFGEMEENTILGITKNGHEVTLSDCFSTTTNNTSFFVNRAYIGCHFNNEVTFRRVLINFNLIEYWAPFTGIDLSFIPEKNTHKILYKPQEPHKIFQNEKFELYVEVIGKFHFRNMGPREVNLSEKVYFKIKFLNEECNIEEIFQMFYDLRNFLSLVVCEPVVHLDCSGYCEAGTTFIGKQTAKKKVKILFRPMSTASITKNIHPQMVLFCLWDVRDSIQDKLKLWFEKSDLLGPAIDLYFSVIHNPPRFLDQRFLFLIQALEVYHRRTKKSKDKELSDRDHQNRIQDILRSAPKDHKDWLEKKLSFSNEISFRRRIKEICNEFPYLFDSTSERKTFINQTYDLRNYLTHYDERFDQSQIEGNDTSQLSYRLEILLKLCFLKEMGVSKDEIESIYKRCFER